MKKILLCLICTFMTCAEKVYFCATIINIQKIMEKYPDLPLERTTVHSHQHSPVGLMHRFRNPDTVCNGDIAYIHASKEIHDDLLKHEYIKQPKIFHMTLPQNQKNHEKN